MADPHLTPSELPSLEQLAEAAEQAFPQAHIGIVRPLLTQPYLIISKGWFAAVLLRPEDGQIAIRAGLPNNGFAVALGGIAMLFGAEKRQQLLREVTTWAHEQKSWALPGTLDPK